MNFINGLMLVDKDPGMTSHDVVAQARRILGTRNIGHAGTLDPLASGLMVLLVGEATKLSDYVLNGDKSYEVGVKFGVKTDSMDITGQILEEKTPDVSEDQIHAAIGQLTGEIALEVPKFSATKVDGRKLYEYARQDKEVELPVKTMGFFDLEIKQLTPQGLIARMRCTKGSFVRAWANKLGEILGCGACVETLRRTRSAPYAIEQALTIEKLKEIWTETRLPQNLGPAWVPLYRALPEFAEIRLYGRDISLIRNGQISRTIEADLLRQVQIDRPLPAVKLVDPEAKELLAILSAQPGEFYKIRRVFHSNRS